MALSPEFHRELDSLADQARFDQSVFDAMERLNDAMRNGSHTKRWSWQRLIASRELSKARRNLVAALQNAGVHGDVPDKVISTARYLLNVAEKNPFDPNHDSGSDGVHPRFLATIYAVPGRS